jgi:hypothetical protein
MTHLQMIAAMATRSPGLARDDRLNRSIRFSAFQRFEWWQQLFPRFLAVNFAKSSHYGAQT